ncbi:hypothetical protein BD410DRAFT_797730 [Rickenella mellea]|uniref:phytol kinase n=1 Tax=Rickenella mellea TaxID=50990 RepID=A0A4R5XFE7_9AGAM|nr:hypothetical protein BD410DRAFT_797730 [Rickenella mellea]
MSSMNCVNPTCTNRDGVEFTVFMKCGACKKVAYCGRACQKAHWKTHKESCKNMRDAPELPDMDEMGQHLDELNEALFGFHTPVSQRIKLRSLSDGSPESLKAKAFADGLEIAEVIEYGIERFLQTKDKGCVMFNMNYPFMATGPYLRLVWLSRKDVAYTGELTLLRNVTQYDPEHGVIILLALPSADLKSMQCWCFETMFVTET